MSPGDLVKIKDELVWSFSFQDRTLVFLRETRARSIIVNGGTREILVGEFLRWDGAIVELDVAMFTVVQSGEPVG